MIKHTNTTTHSLTHPTTTTHTQDRGIIEHLTCAVRGSGTSQRETPVHAIVTAGAGHLGLFTLKLLATLDDHL